MTDKTITVKCVFFGSAKEMAGVGEYAATVPEGARASVLRKQLAERFVILGDAALETNIALNQQYVAVDDDPVLSDRDEVAMIPPISGG
mmetsp:Transcript_36308/g.111345  ORF Transcript_36308/g.111345 Transcript_36308/m.111345 type:complete len:89 (-) Transcript_36308:35-301(-)